jgi:hypothetical protein
MQNMSKSKSKPVNVRRVDLYAIIEDGDTSAWLTPQRLPSLPRAFIGALRCCSSIVDIAKTAHSVIIRQRSSLDGALINATILEYLMEQCQSLKFLSMQDLFLDEDQISAIQ